MRQTSRHLVRLPRREREIMNALVPLGNGASAEDIRARLTNSPSDSSVRVMLARLEKKGYLKHQRDGLRYPYSGTISPSTAKRKALQQLVQTFFRIVPANGNGAGRRRLVVRRGSRGAIDRVRLDRKNKSNSD